MIDPVINLSSLNIQLPRIVFKFLQEWRMQMQEPISQSYLEVEQTTEDAKTPKWKEFEETVKQWKEKQKGAKFKANLFYS